MASTTPNTILLTVNGERRPIFEAEADEALAPGELVEFDTDEELALHDAANGAVAVPKFVVENPFSGDTANPAIDHEYAIGENARYVIPQRGDVVYAYIAASAVLVKGITFLASNGAGALQAITPDATTVVTAVVGVAEEDVTIGGSPARAKVRIL